MTRLRIRRASGVRLSRRALVRQRRHMGTPVRFPTRGPRLGRFALLIVAALVVLTVLLGYHTARRARRHAPAGLTAELQQLTIGALGEPYHDPRGRFTIVPPDGWRQVPAAENNAFDLYFKSPNGPDLGIICKEVEDETFPALLRRLQENERELDLQMNIKVTRFKGLRAAKRTASLQGMRIMAIDFVLDGLSHHIQFTAHPSVFDRYLPAIMDVIDTYVPRSLDTAAAGHP